MAKDQVDLPHLALAQKLLGADEVGPAPLLEADLYNAIRPPHGFHGECPFLDGAGQGLFNVNVLSRRHGRGDHRAVPVVRSCNHHGINVFSVKDSPEVGKGLRFPSGKISSGHDAGLINITERNEVALANLVQELHEMVGSSAGPNHAQT